jgi:hypothetical protein
LVEVIIIDSLKAPRTTGTKMVKGCDWISGSEMKRAVEYLDAAHMKRSLDPVIDIIAIFATPFNCKAFVCVLYTIHVYHKGKEVENTFFCW